MALEERLRIVGKSVDIVNPINSSLTIGDKFKTLIEYQVEQRAAEKQILRLQGRLRGLTRSNAVLRASVQSISTEIATVQENLLTIDVENLPIELQAIHNQLDGIATSINNLPVYVPATPSSDGLMSNIDKAKLDRIEINSVVDLDELVSELDGLKQRIEALEIPEGAE